MNLFNSVVAGKLAGGGSGGGGGVTSWDDLADKPFEDFGELLPVTQFVYDTSYGLFVTPGTIDFKYGDKYIVNWNGVEYTVTATIGYFRDYYYGDSRMPIVVLGNPAPLVGTGGLTPEDNGLPFAIASVMGAVGAIPLDGSTSVSVGIYGTKKLNANYYTSFYTLNVEVDDKDLDADVTITLDSINLKIDTTELVMAILHDRPIFINLKVYTTANGYRVGETTRQHLATGVSFVGGMGDLKTYILNYIFAGRIATMPRLHIYFRSFDSDHHIRDYQFVTDYALNE